MRQALCIALLLAAGAAHAQVQVKDPWVRGTVAQQPVTGAFMKIESAAPARLVEVRAAVAGRVELHETRIEQGVAKMLHVQSIALPAELKPGGYHVMLIDLKRQLKAGETVPLELVVEAGGKREVVTVQAPVRPIHGKAGPHGDADAIRGVLMAAFDRPDARLTVEPVVVVGNFAVAGWIQSDRGGRALLRSEHGAWKLVACAGDAFKRAKELEHAGIPAGDARQLSQALAKAEGALPQEHVRKLALFEGVVKMDKDGAHPPVHGHHHKGH